MKQPVLVKAAVTGAEVGHLADEILRLEKSGVDGLHFDVRDGRFGPEISMGVMFVRGLRKYTRLPFEVHLWIDRPEPDLDSYIDAGADIVLVHVEACADPAEVLRRIREKGRGAGLAINTGTPVDRVVPLLCLCDEVNVMTIRPGWPGELDEEGVKNLRAICSAARQHGEKLLIQVDGAVSMKTRDLFVDGGARSLVAGYPIFSQQDYRAAIAELRSGVAAAASPVQKA